MASVKQSQHRRSGAKAWSDLEGGCLMKRTFVKFAVAGGLAVSMASGARTGRWRPDRPGHPEGCRDAGRHPDLWHGHSGPAPQHAQAGQPRYGRASWRRSGPSPSAARSSAARKSQPIVYDGKMFVTALLLAPVRARRDAPARSCGSTSTACPKASCRAATWSTAARRSYDNLVIFAHARRAARRARPGHRRRGLEARRSTTTRRAIR